MYRQERQWTGDEDDENIIQIRFELFNRDWCGGDFRKKNKCGGCWGDENLTEYGLQVLFAFRYMRYGKSIRLNVERSNGESI